MHFFPGMSDLNVPQPKNKVVKFDQVKSFDQALDYAMGGYHASQKHANGDTPEGRLWQEAATAYYAAYIAMKPLEALPGDQAFTKAKELLHDANHKADIASASRHSS